MWIKFLSGLAVAFLGAVQTCKGCNAMWENGGKQTAEKIKNKFCK